MTYQLLCASVQGASHIKHGLPCEDAGLTVKQEHCGIFVTSDGHGDSNCPRSSFGAEQVCRVAAEELQTFAEAIHEENWEDRLFDENERERLLRQLIVSIVTKWKTTVEEDYAVHPLTEEERSGAERYLERYDRGERISHIYGSTMIAGLLTDRYLLLLQQGDGRCVVFGEDGSASQPIPWDELCFANVTTSMCDEDAIRRCRYEVLDLRKNPVCAVFAGSDGVEDSFFSMEQMESYYRKLLIYTAEHSVEELRQDLMETLPDFSAKGSGDDTTITGIIDEERARILKDRFLQDLEETKKAGQLRRIEERLASMEGKLEYLREKYEKSEDEYRSFFQKLFSAKDDRKKAADEYLEYKAAYERLQEEKRKLLTDRKAEETV